MGTEDGGCKGSVVVRRGVEIGWKGVQVKRDFDVAVRGEVG